MDVLRAIKLNSMNDPMVLLSPVNMTNASTKKPPTKGLLKNSKPLMKSTKNLLLFNIHERS